MKEFLANLETKTKKFVQSSPQFQSAADEAFTQADINRDGKLTIFEAAACVDAIFAHIQTALEDYGIQVKHPTPEEVTVLFREGDYDANAMLSKEEFKVFYANVVVYAAIKAATGFGKSYGWAVAGGIVGMMVVKRAIRAIPVAGSMAKPVLRLFPSLLFGPLIGCTVVYGLQKGDLLAIRHKLFPQKEQQFTAK